MNAERTAWALGLLGLIPFAAGAIVFGYGQPLWRGPALLGLLAYATAILSFLGGVRWGCEMNARAASPLALTGSNLAPIAGFALLAAPGLTAAWQIGGFVLAFVLQWLWDLQLRGAPPWWPRLRTALTAGVCVCLAVALEAALDLTG
jgi:hypothetical protein